MAKYTVVLHLPEATHLGLISALDNRAKKKLLEEYCRKGILQRAMELNIAMTALELAAGELSRALKGAENESDHATTAGRVR